ncbi:MAG TPA: malto-oligosyltrehalose synthase [Micropepsaceae bacterium]|nr:malto-oligosyltrehalose synthase [Micropepsaceae bacterium]
MSGTPRPPVPRATYRVQFHKAFTFDDGAKLASYLARLGISHLYASPYLKARPGSTHGYDIVDHNALNPELGGETAFRRMVEALGANELGQILDFVPNHMGAGGSDNPIWLDVLEWGRESHYAGWFDIDWEPSNQYLRGKLLVPFLGGQYGAELESGNLELKFDGEEGSFAVWAYGTHKLPVCPLHYNQILGDTHPALERLGDAFAGLPDWRPQVAQRAAELKQKLAALAVEDPSAHDAISTALGRFNGKPGDLASWKELDRLIAQQNWRASYFRVAADDINYRRFFNINDLAGLRMELPDVFERTHHLVFRLLREGVLDGLRIDHIDGLFDPKCYLLRLREHSPRPDFYCVVEKILASHENLRADWPVQGTTGYDFANLLLGILIDPDGEEAFTRAYADFTGVASRYPDVVRESKHWIEENEMASELNVLARQAARVARQNPRTADFTRHVLARALREVVACFPVYRTYADEDNTVSDSERRYLDWAIAQASRRQTNIDPSVYEFLRALLSGELAARPKSGFNHSTALRCAMRFQQYTGPVMAKGVEDTAFYRFNRFIALNEVGGNAGEFGISLTAFHNANAERARLWPHAMLGTATHDTKRGEDTRARLAVLSEMPDEWKRQVQNWSSILRAGSGDLERKAPPDRDDEYLFYQLLTGSWPVELMADVSDTTAVAEYSWRIRNAMVKSMREAKTHSSWAAPDPAYEDAVLDFISAALDPARAGNFFAEFLPFVSEVARFGMLNTIAQTVLKLTVPGVPDFYQGAELWDFSLVDPDNRRAVDYELRARLMDEVSTELRRDRQGAMRRYLGQWQDARFKLAIIATLLDYRRAHDELFRDGSYRALQVEGQGAERLCAFIRQHGSEVLVTAVARHPVRVERENLLRDTFLILPEEHGAHHWRDLLSAGNHRASGRIAASELFGIMPSAVLTPA